MDDLLHIFGTRPDVTRDAAWPKKDGPIAGGFDQVFFNPAAPGNPGRSEDGHEGQGARPADTGATDVHISPLAPEGGGVMPTARQALLANDPTQPTPAPAPVSAVSEVVPSRSHRLNQLPLAAVGTGGAVSDGGQTTAGQPVADQPQTAAPKGFGADPNAQTVAKLISPPSAEGALGVPRSGPASSGQSHAAGVPPQRHPSDGPQNGEKRIMPKAVDAPTPPQRQVPRLESRARLSQREMARPLLRPRPRQRRQIPRFRHRGPRPHRRNGAGPIAQEALCRCRWPNPVTRRQRLCPRKGSSPSPRTPRWLRPKHRPRRRRVTLNLGPAPQSQRNP